MSVSDVFESIHCIVKYFVAVDPLTLLHSREWRRFVIAWIKEIIR